MSAPYTTLALSRAEYLALLAALDDRVERCEQRAADDDDYWREARTWRRRCWTDSTGWPRNDLVTCGGCCVAGSGITSGCGCRRSGSGPSEPGNDETPPPPGEG